MEESKWRDKYQKLLNITLDLLLFIEHELDGPRARRNIDFVLRTFKQRIDDEILKRGEE